MASNVVSRLRGVKSSLAIKCPCRVATTANITLSGLQTIDGVTVIENDRVLVKDQNGGWENGIYAVSTGPWRRAPDWDGSGDVVTGTRVFITDGSANRNVEYRVTTANPISIGATSIALETIGTAHPADWVSLASFNIGPSMTDDLTASINAAIASISKGVLVIPPGDYRVDSKIIIANKNEANTTTASNLEILAFGARFINAAAAAGEVVLEIDDCKFLRIHGLEVQAAKGCKVLFDGMWSSELSHLKTGGLIWSFGEDNLDTFESHYWSKFTRCELLAVEFHTGVFGGDRTEANAIEFDTCYVGARPHMSETGVAYAVSVYGSTGPAPVRFRNCDLSYYTTGLIYVDEAVLSSSPHIDFDGGLLDSGLVGTPEDLKGLTVNFYGAIHAPGAPIISRTRLNEGSKQVIDVMSGATLGSRYPTSAYNLVKNGDLRDGASDITLSSGGANITATPTPGDYGLFGQHVNIVTAVNRNAEFTSIPVPFDGHYSWTIVMRNNGDALRSAYKVNTVSTTFDAVRIPADGEFYVLSYTNLVAVEAGDVLAMNFFGTDPDFDLDYDIAYVGLTYGRVGQLYAPLHPMASATLSMADSNKTHRQIIAAGSDLTANRTLTLAPGDADRTLTLSGNPTLSDWFDQSVKAAAAPTFAGLLLTEQATIAATPASGSQRHFVDDTGRQFTILSTGRMLYMGGPATGRQTRIQANQNSTTINVVGSPAPSSDGTATAQAIASTNYFTRQHRIQNISAASTGANCGHRFGDFKHLADAGLVCIRFGWEDFASDAAAFIGIKGSAAHGNADPSSFVSCIGVGIDSGQTTWRLLHNDASGTATAADLGANFPANTDATDFYELMLWWPSGGAKVNYQLVRLNTGHVASGQITTNLPAATSAIASHVIGNTRTGSSAISLSWSSVISEVL